MTSLSVESISKFRPILVDGQMSHILVNTGSYLMYNDLSGTDVECEDGLW